MYAKSANKEGEQCGNCFIAVVKLDTLLLVGWCHHGLVHGLWLLILILRLWLNWWLSTRPLKCRSTISTQKSVVCDHCVFIAFAMWTC